MEDDKPKKKKLKLGKLGKGPQDAEQADRAKIPRITVSNMIALSNFR